MMVTVPLAVLFGQFLPALVTSNILNRLSEGDFESGDVWGSFGGDILLIAALLVLGPIVMWRINMYLEWRLEAKIVGDIHRQVFDHLMRLGANFHANHFGGSLVSQANKLAGAYIRIAATTMFQTGVLVWSVVFTSVLLWGQAPLFVILLIIFCTLYAISAFLVTSRVRNLSQVEADSSNKVTGQLADSITNVMAVKSFAAGRAEYKRFGKVIGAWQDAMINLMWATMRSQNAFAGIGSIIGIVAVVLAIASVVVYDANIGVVFLIYTYTNYIRQKLWEFSNQALRNYNRAFGDAQAMTEILAIEPEIKDPAHPEELRIAKGAIQFRHMDFTHPDSGANETLFVDLNLDIKPGEKIGLVGHSGSGKTTMTKLLLRFNDIDGGEILIDGQSIASIAQDDLRKSIAYVPQEPLLFHRSIRENIAYGKPDATDAEVKRAAERAHATEFIDKLPQDYDTLVGERGVKLSGGQRQRIAIARAMIKQAPILVLDEATSALDSESEQLIQEALWTLMEGRTAIVIAHRLSTIQKMDRIIVLEDGKIVEEGSHKQLLKKKRGVYAGLWAHQSGGFLEE